MRITRFYPEGMRIRVILLLAVCAFMLMCGAAAEEKEAYSDIVILSTTDLHGKCWDTNLLTGFAEKNNILRISTAVNEIREQYGKENVLLIDNGDLYQGTQISEYQLKQRHMDQSDDPLVMALCLKEIGYTASVLGNHEFNYPWEVMRENYRWLEENGVPVLAANICRDGTEAGTDAGDSAFTPYIIREVTVNGHAHKIGILGLENCDIARWDLPDNYPGLQFVHPGNADYSMTEEINLFLPEMKAQGCEFIIVSYHGGFGETAETELVYGVNTSYQALRIIMESHDIDLMINGHDHTGAYSGNMIANADGREIPLVNGGGQELTRVVFRFTEDEDGKLAWTMLEAGNVDPTLFAVDERLQELVRPYAEMAERYVTEPLGTAEGEWDENRQFLREQTHSMDLIARACIGMTTRRIAEMAEDTGEKALMAKTGTDHLDTDISILNCNVYGKYVMRAGPISLKDIYQLNRFSNMILVIPMTGEQIKAVMEENAAGRVSVRVHDREVFYYSKGHKNTHLLFGGMNYTCDMARPEGERIVIEGFANGRPFDPDMTYLAAVSNYVLGNERCGLRNFSVDDVIWRQTEESGETIQNLIAEYTILQGRVTPAEFNWTWKNIFSGSMEDTALPEEETAAVLVPVPKDGQRVVIYSEAEQCALTGKAISGALETEAWEAQGPALRSPRPDAVLVFTVQATENGTYRFRTPDGRWLVPTADGIMLSAEPEREEQAWWTPEQTGWTLEPAYGGWNIVSTEMKQRALEVNNGLVSAFRRGEGDTFIFNFYEPGSD